MKYRNILLTAMVSSVFGLQNAAQAATDITVGFTGEVATSCGVSNAAAGTMTIADSSSSKFGARPDRHTGGQMGSFDVSCTSGTGTVTINDPVATTADSTALSSQSGHKLYADLFSGANASGYLATSPSGQGILTFDESESLASGTYYIDTHVETSAKIAPGTYGYEVTVSITDD